MSAGQVKIGREFFAKIKLDYANWEWALIREFLQNSFDAPKCNRVEVTIREEGGDVRLIVYNNGAPMDEATLFGKLLTLGGSGKNFEGENTGGFGVAKSLLYYCHKSYAITTGNLFVQGSGAEYTHGPAIEYLPGTDSTVLVEGTSVEALVRQCKRFADRAQWKGQLIVNGETLACDLKKGSRRKDLGWGVVYTNHSFENSCVVRLNGQPMFTMYARFKGCVLVELTGKALETLTSNRDALKGKFQSELSDLLTAIAVDKKSALKEQRAEYKRYLGEKQRNEAKQPKTAGGIEAIGITLAEVAALMGPKHEVVQEVVPVEGRNAEPVPESATEGRGQGGMKLIPVSKEDVATVTLGPEFILKNATGMKTPVRYVPGEHFSNHSKELVLAWTAVLLKLYQLHNVSGEFSVGFVFDDESEAEHETGVYGRVYYLNPAKIVETNGRRCMEARYTSAWSNRHNLIALACHEFVHGLGFKDHDEDYASKLTDVTQMAMKHMSDLEAMCKAPKDQTPKEKKQHEDIFGHTVSAIIRWMGKNGWKFSEAQRVLEERGLTDVAEGTIRTYLQAGKQGLRGAPAELTPEQAHELKYGPADYMGMPEGETNA